MVLFVIDKKRTGILHMLEKNTESTFLKRTVLKYIFLAAAGNFGILLVLLSTSKFGPGISADSVAYMHAGRSLLEGKGYMYFGFNAPFVQWPPLYSTVLAIIGLFGVDIAAAANYLNAFVFGLIIFISGLWLTKNIKSGIYVLWGIGALIFSVPLLYVSGYAWSEPIFILLILLFIIKMQEFMKAKKQSCLILSAVYAALACITRYIGVVLVFTGLIAVLFQRRKFLDRLRDMFIFGCISSLPLGIWIVRNYIISGTLFGARTPSIYTLGQNVVFTIKTLASWAIPCARTGTVFGYAQVQFLKAAAAAFCIAAVVFLVWLVLKKVNGHSAEKACGDGKKTALPKVTVPLLFVAIYIVYLIASATSVAFDNIDNRLLSPVSVPLVLMACVILDEITLLIRRCHKNRFFAYILSLFAVLWLVCPAMSAVSEIRLSRETGFGGFNTTRWHTSSLIGLLKEAPLEGEIYSNCPDAIYALTGKPASYTPRKNSLDMYGFERFKEVVEKSRDLYVVWFKKYPAGPNYSVEELQENYNLKRISGTQEGDIFRLSPKQ